MTKIIIIFCLLLWGYPCKIIETYGLMQWNADIILCVFVFKYSYVQHLLDAATVSLPTSKLSSLWHVVNLLAAGKAPKELSIYCNFNSFVQK